MSLKSLAVLIAIAGLPVGAAGAADDGSDEARIRAELQASEDAWNRGDLKGHLASYDPAVTFMTKDGPRPGVAGIEKAFADKYFRDGKPKQQLRLDQIEVRALDDDAALATGRFVLAGGGEPEQSGRFTTVRVRKPEGWRTVHDHSS
ncbi:MAG: YybH family protein [Steroidobacteraceae bacterium]